MEFKYNINLYYGRSRLKSFQGLESVSIVWFRYDLRPDPVAPYESVIARYPELDPHTRQLMEEFVDEHLLSEEINALGKYLRVTHGWTLTAQAETLPAEYIVDPDWGRRTTPYRHYTPYDGRDPYIAFYKLSEERGYSLPFAVWGYYNPEHGKRLA